MTDEYIRIGKEVVLVCLKEMRVTETNLSSNTL
jgi:hypothetical protein